MTLWNGVAKIRKNYEDMWNSRGEEIWDYLWEIHKAMEEAINRGLTKEEISTRNLKCRKKQKHIWKARTKTRLLRFVDKDVAILSWYQKKVRVQGRIIY